MRLGIWRKLPLFLLGAAVAHGLPASAQAVESGISRGLAASRAARLSDLRYGLRYRLEPHSADLHGEETVTFDDRGGGDLPIDFRDGTVERAKLNGQEVTLPEENGHLLLPHGVLREGANRLEVQFTVHSAPAGKAITRYTDKDDGSEYLYTLFVPMDAEMAFPCFDQPDLKGRFALQLSLPPGWTAIGNTTPTVQGQVASFPETLPISTYLFAFAAGPWARIAPSAAGKAAPGQPALYVRRSQLARAQAEAPEVQRMTADGIRWLSAYFAQPFPFPKYDLVLIPGFPFGGMEHAGATFLNEDGVLFRSAPTESDRFRRDILVLHETTHQWFGDLVTMRWFDDLWLKEGFAQYMAYKAMAALKPETAPWKHFYEGIKPLAYGIDETEGTTPIFQDIPNLKDAKSAYGAIVYQKAPAVLKQLDFRLGDTVFRQGLQQYLRQHAYGNATWPDLIGAFIQAGGQDVQGWADAWILRRGMPEISVASTCRAGRIESLTLHQHDVLADGYVWPMTNELALAGRDGQVKTLRVNWSKAEKRVEAANGLPCPAYVFANAGDQAYGRFLLDPETQRFLLPAAGSLAASPLETAEPLLRAMLWGSLWDGVRTASLSPATYVAPALTDLATEKDETLARVQGARVATSLQFYLGAAERTRFLAPAEAVLRDRMLHAPTLGMRIVSFRGFASLAESPDALGSLKQMLAGTLAVPGMPLRPLDRWNLIAHLTAQGDPEAPVLFAAEQAQDHSGEAQKYAYAAGAGKADAAVKARYFEQYLHSNTVQEDWITASLPDFNAWNQSALTEPYLRAALDALPSIKRDRKIFFLGAWLNAFLGGQHSAQAQAVVHAWLAQPGTDPDLRRKVLEVSDGLDRTVRIRARYGQ